MMCRWNKNL